MTIDAGRSVTPARACGRWQRCLLVAAMCLTGVATMDAPATAQTPEYKEYQLKAVFLFNFAQFVNWPATAFSARDSPLVICVLGEDPFGDYLEATVRGERVNDHPLVVRHYRRIEDVANCHILFIGPPDRSHLESVAAGLKDRSILTVGDTANFAKRGGMIEFVTENNKIRLLINLDAATAANLTLSSKLLHAAQIVPGGGR